MGGGGGGEFSWGKINSGKCLPGNLSPIPQRKKKKKKKTGHHPVGRRVSRTVLDSELKLYLLISILNVISRDANFEKLNTSKM